MKWKNLNIPSETLIRQLIKRLEKLENFQKSFEDDIHYEIFDQHHGIIGQLSDLRSMVHVLEVKLMEKEN
ncbi:MAG: hypothetical protein Unbinned202contig1000_28 [Prokaryotic dsDNA virus sp.]|nr:MAG: hypothetical protein Unbinned202contig1000_28 [Prokaryotic dsDNA virus sp.]|tara:strand:- start:8440 stop:8649 length:210 start_codon:yes stop_codon:yes gene_type:complete